MNTESKKWWNNNFLGVMIVLMLGSYFAYDLVDKHQNRLEHIAIAKTQTLNEEKFRIFAGILVNDPDTDPETKSILREYLKITTRSGETE